MQNDFYLLILFDFFHLNTDCICYYLWNINFFQGDRVLGVTLLGGFAEECVVEQSVRNLPL